MKNLSVAIMVFLLATACATPDVGGFSYEQIREACMKIEVAGAVSGASGKAPMSPEDAKAYGGFICNMVAGTCSKNPEAGACQRDLRRYGLLK